MEELCDTSTNSSPTWGLFDVFKWKIVPESFGGGRAYIQRFKDAWVVHNKLSIKAAALKYSLPVQLLAGVCWIETGGDPNFIDRVAFEVRAFDHIGNSSHVVTNPPTKTSFGLVSIQLRTAAYTLGLDADKMAVSELRSLSHCLERDVYNIDLAAKHLRMLADHDHFVSIGLEEARVIGSRYNRGMELSLDKIMQNTRYGDFIVKNWLRFTQLIM